MPFPDCLQVNQRPSRHISSLPSREPADEAELALPRMLLGSPHHSANVYASWSDCPALEPACKSPKAMVLAGNPAAKACNHLTSQPIQPGGPGRRSAVHHQVEPVYKSSRRRPSLCAHALRFRTQHAVEAGGRRRWRWRWCPSCQARQHSLCSSQDLARAPVFPRCLSRLHLLPGPCHGDDTAPNQPPNHAKGSSLGALDPHWMAAAAEEAFVLGDQREVDPASAASATGGSDMDMWRALQAVIVLQIG